LDFPDDGNPRRHVNDMVTVTAKIDNELFFPKKDKQQPLPRRNSAF